MLHCCLGWVMEVNMSRIHNNDGLELMYCEGNNLNKTEK